MPTNITTIQPITPSRHIETARTRVEIHYPSQDTDYTGGEFVNWPEAFCEQIILRRGATPGEAVVSFQLPRGKSSVGSSFGHVLWSARGGLTPFTTKDAPFVGEPRALYKVRVWRDDGLRADRGGTDNLLFVGYISRMVLSTMAKQGSSFIIRVPDARFLMKYAPCAGVIHWNPIQEKFVYIRDTDPVMNMLLNGRHVPNRWYDSSKLGDRNPDIFPAFITPDHNRFYTYHTDTDPIKDKFRQYIEDAEIDNVVDLNQFGNIFYSDERETLIVDNSIARKWQNAHAWNYWAMMFDADSIGLGNDDIAKFDDPAPASVTIDDVTIPLSDEVVISKVYRSDENNINNIAGADWYRPRGVMGEDGGPAINSEISGLGEFNAFGTSIIDVLDHLCREKVGNYDLVAEYIDEGTGKLSLMPFRTHKGIWDTTDVKWGTTPKWPIRINMPTDDDETHIPDVKTMQMTASWDNLRNIAHIKGGKRIIQVTVGTQGWASYIDHLGYFHEAYSPPAGEWDNDVNIVVPALAYGWDYEQLNLYMQLSVAEQAEALFPDVFRALILRDDINLTNLWAQTVKTEGFRRYFERPHGFLNNLITSIYTAVRSAFRDQRVKIPIQIHRCYRGKRTVTADGSDTTAPTRYGDKTTESTPTQTGKGARGKEDLFLGQAGMEALNDGARTGVRLDIASRANDKYPFEGPTQAQIDAGDTAKGPSRSPWSWNGIRVEDENQSAETLKTRPALKWQARPYEFFLTFAMETDEDLFQFRPVETGGMPIITYGPRMEQIRSANYGQHMTGNSFVSLPVDKGDHVKDTPSGERRVYTDGEQELDARAKMMLNRHARHYVEAPINLGQIKLSHKPGMTVDQVKRYRGANKIDDTMEIKGFLDTVIHDFRNQDTSIGIATIR